MAEVLKRVRRAAHRKLRAELEYREAIRAARVAGLTYTEIGAAAGISKQAARDMLERVLAPETERKR